MSVLMPLDPMRARTKLIADKDVRTDFTMSRMGAGTVPAICLENTDSSPGFRQAALRSRGLVSAGAEFSAGSAARCEWWTERLFEDGLRSSTVSSPVAGGTGHTSADWWADRSALIQAT